MDVEATSEAFVFAITAGDRSNSKLHGYRLKAIFSQPTRYGRLHILYHDFAVSICGKFEFHNHKTRFLLFDHVLGNSVRSRDDPTTQHIGKDVSE